jgi:hypothetical protein
VHCRLTDATCITKLTAATACNRLASSQPLSRRLLVVPHTQKGNYQLLRRCLETHDKKMGARCQLFIQQRKPSLLPLQHLLSTNCYPMQPLEPAVPAARAACCMQASGNVTVNPDCSDSVWMALTCMSGNKNERCRHQCMHFSLCADALFASADGCVMHMQRLPSHCMGDARTQCSCVSQVQVGNIPPKDYIVGRPNVGQRLQKMSG